MKLIVAVDNKWGIGKNGDLLKSIPEDMKYFREKTKNKILVMGYKTLLSFPGSKPLPGRLNIVLADIENLRIPGCVTVESLDELFRLSAFLESDDIYVIGGGYTYRQLLPYCDTAYITKMDFSGDADTYFDDLDQKEEWQMIESSELFDHDNFKYAFTVYKNSAVLKAVTQQKAEDLKKYFIRKKEITFDLFEYPDDEYIHVVSEALKAYFFPLRNGFNSQDAEDFFNELLYSEITFEDYLKDNCFIAEQKSFNEIYQEYLGKCEKCVLITVKSENIERFLSLLENKDFDALIDEFKFSL